MSKQNASGDAAFLEKQRKRLVAMRDQLANAEKARVERDRAPKSVEAEELEDDAQELAQGEIDDAVHLVEEQRLRAIDRALAKIDEGTYGLSELSGDPIPKARLEAIPEALLTIEEEEAREKRVRR
jgi:DnaK suppressor protein